MHLYVFSEPRPGEFVLDHETEMQYTPGPKVQWLDDTGHVQTYTIMTWDENMGIGTGLLTNVHLGIPRP